MDFAVQKCSGEVKQTHINELFNSARKILVGY